LSGEKNFSSLIAAIEKHDFLVYSCGSFKPQVRDATKPNSLPTQGFPRHMAERQPGRIVFLPEADGGSFQEFMSDRKTESYFFVLFVVVLWN